MPTATVEVKNGMHIIRFGIWEFSKYGLSERITITSSKGQRYSYYLEPTLIDDLYVVLNKREELKNANSNS